MQSNIASMFFQGFKNYGFRDFNRTEVMKRMIALFKSVNATLLKNKLLLKLNFLLFNSKAADQTVKTVIKIFNTQSCLVFLSSFIELF